MGVAPCRYNLLLLLQTSTSWTWRSSSRLCSLITCTWSCYWERRISKRLKRIWRIIETPFSCGWTKGHGSSDVTMPKVIKKLWWSNWKWWLSRTTKWRMMSSSRSITSMSTWSLSLWRTLKLRVWVTRDFQGLTNYLRLTKHLNLNKKRLTTKIAGNQHSFRVFCSDINLTFTHRSST